MPRKVYYLLLYNDRVSSIIGQKEQISGHCERFSRNEGQKLYYSHSRSTLEGICEFNAKRAG
jgi:hypothetical protein